MRAGLLTVKCCRQHGCKLAEVRRDDDGTMMASTKTRTELLDASGDAVWETHRLRQRLDVVEPVAVDCGHECLQFGHGPLLSAAEVEAAILADTPVIYLG